MSRIDDARQALTGGLAAIVESSQDAIFRKTLDGVIESWNAGAQSIYGYRPEEIIGHPVSTLAPPDRKDEITYILERIARGERVEHFSTKRVTKDGRTIDVSLSISPVFDDGGRVVGAASIARDITQQRLAERELRIARQQLAIITRAGADGITIHDASGRIVYANDSAARMSGYPDARSFMSAPAEEVLGRFELLHEDGRPFSPEELPTRRILRGEEHAGALIHVVARETREEHWTLVRAAPMHDDDGTVDHVVNVFRDVTEDRKREEGQRFLAQATKELVSSLDYQATLSRIARMAVPQLADWCAVDILEPDGSLKLLAIAHRESSKIEWAREFRRAFPIDMTAPTGLPRVIRTGKSELYPSIDPALLQASLDEEQLEVIRELHLSSVMLLPLRARGRTLGAISFVFAESGRSYGEADLVLAEDLASRAALALDNARLYRERDDIARTLQEGLLPGPFPEVPGVELAARYRAAGEGIDVGGDFYDAFDTEDGAWALVVGDVCGKGPKAAALMGTARHTIRAAALREHRPSAVLMTLNTALQQQSREQWFCTVCYVRLRPQPGGARLTVCAGGHPLPAILRADGTVEFAGSPGTLLGVFTDIELTDATVDLGPGDALVLFTDGLTDAERTGREFGQKWLTDVLARNVGRSVEEIARSLEREVLGDQTQGLPDDLAILVARVKP
jgi:PAS domain S-box-containing protein